ncbi:MAG TPA: hypothetical protein VGF94_29960 [Kofleriaceae bacterium]|jgi:hypothetical protein
MGEAGSERTFVYGLRGAIARTALAIFAVGTAFDVWQLVRAKHDSSRIVLGVGMAVMLAFSVNIVISTLGRRSGKNRIAIGAHAMHLPTGRMTNPVAVVLYEHLASVTLVPARTKVFVTHAGGRVGLPRSMLGSDAEFEELCALLFRKLAEVRASSGGQ